MISAIILAGAPIGEFGDGSNENMSRAMVRLKDKPMLDYILGPICENVDETLVVGNVETDYNCSILEPANSLMENIQIAINKVKGEYILLATSDIPLITNEDVKNFIVESKKINCGFVYPICSKDDCNKYYPQLKRTYVKVKEGSFTGGNIMFMKKDFLLKIMPIMKELYNARKSPLKIAKMIGFDVIWRLLFVKMCPSILSIEFLEGRISKIFGDKVKALIMESPNICEDCDKVEDLDYFEKLIL